MPLHDKEIREPLFDFLEETYGRVRVIEEKMMGRSRAMLQEGKKARLRLKNPVESR